MPTVRAVRRRARLAGVVSPVFPVSGGHLWTRPGLARVSGAYLKEFSWLSASNQVTSLLSLATTVLLARVVPVTELGQVAFAQSAAVLAFLILDPRFEDAVQRYVPLLRLQSERRARAFYWRLVRWDLLLGLTVTAAGLVVWLAGGYPQNRVCRPDLMALAVTSVGLAAAVGTLQAGFAVTGGLSALGRVTLGVSILGAGLRAAGVLLFGAPGYLAAGAVSSTVQVAVLLAANVRRLGNPALAASGRAGKLPAGLFRFVVSSSLSASASVGVDSGVLAVAAVSGGPELAAILKVAGAPGRVLQSALSPIAAQAFPRLSALAAAGDGGGVRRLTSGVTRVLLVPAVLAVVIGTPLMRPAIGVVYGPRYQVASTLAVLLLIAGALRVLVLWGKVLPLAVGRPGLRLACVAAESVAAIGMAYIVPLLVGDPNQAGVGIGIGTVVIAASLATFWIRMSGRADLLVKVGTPPAQPCRDGVPDAQRLSPPEHGAGELRSVGES